MKKTRSFFHAQASRFLRYILNGRIVYKKINGSDMRLYYERSQHLTFLFHKTIQYEKNIQRKLAKMLKEGDLVFDLGANIGQYALFFSEIVGDSGIVVSVEPEIENYAYLQFNSHINRCSNIVCLNIGIAREKGERTLYSDSITGGRKSSFFIEETGMNYRGKMRHVQVLGYDDLVREFGSPRLVKIDVEGAETDILEGIIDLSENTLFFVEVRDISKRSVFNYFTEKGFICLCAEKGDFSLIDDIEQIPDGVINLFFLPAERETIKKKSD